MENDELEFDPKTLKSKPRKTQATAEKKSSKPQARTSATAKDASVETPTQGPKRVRKQGGTAASRAAKEEQPEAMEPPDLDPDTPPFPDEDMHGVHAYAPDGY